MSVKRALITGITGQDGSYLAELLLGRGYEVYGTVRRAALEDPPGRLWRILPILDRLHLQPASLESYASVLRVVEEVRPDECYHLAAQSYVNYTFEDGFSTIAANVSAAHHLLSALRDRAPACRYYFAASSEMFGNASVSPQNEDTPFNPRSPYGISKVAAFYLTKNYRQGYGLFACNGIAYNHESVRRGQEYLPRKVSVGVARIRSGQARQLRLGNLEARRDWGFAPDYVEAMWRMLQAPEPDDYIIATGVSHSVQQLVERAFAAVGLDWNRFVVLDREVYRPAEACELRGDAAKARAALGWEPRVGFDEMIRMMVDADLQKLLGSAPGEGAVS
jgi:GDPmannose 4,6-dehydratase